MPGTTNHREATMSDITLTPAEADILYGMLTQRLYLRHDDPDRALVVSARDKLYPLTCQAQPEPWQHIPVREWADAPNPIIATRRAPDGGTARLYADGSVDAVEGGAYSLSPGFDTWEALVEWISEQG